MCASSASSAAHRRLIGTSARDPTFDALHHGEGRTNARRHAPPPAPSHDALLLQRATHIPCDHTRRTALLCSSAPLVSGFASMAGCHDKRKGLAKGHVSYARVHSLAGVDAEYDCKLSLPMTDGCMPNEPTMFDLIGAGSCQYQVHCTGDGALAVLFSDDDEEENADDDDEPMTCSSFAMADAMASYQIKEH